MCIMDYQLCINILANTIINAYFRNTHCFYIITNSESSFKYEGDLPFVLFVVENSSETNLHLNYLGCDVIVIDTEKPSKTLADFEKAIKLTVERFNYRKYLIIQNAETNDDDDLLNLEELKYITNLLIISPAAVSTSENNTEFYLKTHKYVGVDTNNEMIILDRWFCRDQDFFHHRNLYPDKIHNQEGRILKMVTFTYEPYSIAEGTAYESDGTEMRFVLEYVKKHNMTPSLKISKKDDWGEIFSNWSGTGLMGHLVMDEGDVGFAALYSWEEDYYYLDFSKPLSRTGVTCLVPTPKLAAGWFTPLFPFTPPMWIAVLLSFLCSTIVLFMLNYAIQAVLSVEISNVDAKSWRKLRQTNWDILDQSLLRITAVFLLQSISMGTKVANNKITRYLMGSVLLVSLLIATSYSSGLASSMTVPRYENAIRTTQDLANSRISWGATSTAWLLSIASVEEQKYVTLRKNFVATTEKELTNLAYSGKFAFSMERLPHGHYAIGSYVPRGANLIPMREDLYWEQCIVMLRKNSVLLPSLDALILKITESGIPAYWESQVASKYLDSQIQKSVEYLSHHHDTNKGPVKLKWIHVEGAFAVLAIGHFIALVCFLLETVYHHFYANIPFIL